MDPHEEYFLSLSRDERALLALRQILYGGRWEEMIEDLLARKQGKPYVFKLQARLADDLGRIERLRAYEESHGVDLGSLAERLELSESDDADRSEEGTARYRN